MRKPWLAVSLALCAGSAAQGQQPGGYPYQPYYRPAPAPQVYYPQPQNNYYLPTTPPRGVYAPYGSGGSTVAQPSPVVTSGPPVETVVEATPPAPVYRRTAQTADPAMPAIPAMPSIPGIPGLPESHSGSIVPYVEMTPGAACADGCVAPPVLVKPKHRRDCMWFNVNYIAAFMRPMTLAAPIISVGSDTDAPAGALGQPGTSVLYGNQTVNFNLASGASVNLGFFLDEAGHYSLDIGAFGIFPNTQSYSIASDAGGNPLIARPIYDTSSNQLESLVTARPGVSSGSLRADVESLLYGGEFNARYHACINKHFKYDFLVGARYIRLAESLDIHENVNGINGNTFAFGGQNFDSFTDHDRFATTNQFIGGQLGVRGTCEYSWLSFTGFAKLGLGATMQRVAIEGSTTYTNAAGSVTYPAGVLALGTNVGTYSRTVFGVVPEMGFNVGLNVTDHIRLQIGASTMLWNKVVRPGSQYSDYVNSGLVPSSGNFGNVGNGSVAPIFRYREDFFWINSLNLGLEVHF